MTPKHTLSRTSLVNTLIVEIVPDQRYALLETVQCIYESCHLTRDNDAAGETFIAQSLIITNAYCPLFALRPNKQTFESHCQQPHHLEGCE